MKLDINGVKMVTEKKISEVMFSLLSPDMVRKMSAAKVIIPDTYDDDGYPIDGGLVDLRLGVVDPGLRCKTCGGKVKECPGHFGHIELVRPVVHTLFGKEIYHILSKTCPKCHRYTGEGKKKTCPHCEATLPEVKFVKPTGFYIDGESLLPTDVRDWLSQIPEGDLRDMGYSPEYANPKWMILSALPVPPVNMRPSITLESGERSEDDLTHKLVDIIRINQKLATNISAGAPQLIIEDLWELLQYHITTYFDNETSNIPPARHRSGRALKTITQRLKGKEGRFRYNLSGKRVNFSARTVISPDPDIEMNMVGMPYIIAKKMTVPIAVTEWNKKQCQKLITAVEYPRALYIIRDDKRKIRLIDDAEMRKEAAKNLKVGGTIERQVIDGDIVLFNRQPSLHRISMMAHYVKVLPGKTFRVNPVSVAPYNADFDGDEMNLHLLQTEESKAEARYLMSLELQILSPRYGHAIIRPQEDQISGLYLLTRDGVYFNKKEATELLYESGITEIPKPDHKNMYSGKLLFSQLLTPDINIKKTSELGQTVVIKKGKLIKGGIDNKIIGGTLLEYIFLKYGPEHTKDFLDKVTQMGLYAITNIGFSVSLKSYNLSEKADKTLDEMLDTMNREINLMVEKYKNKSLERSPGLGLKATLEGLIMQKTSETRHLVGNLVDSDLTLENPSIIMAKIGARGSLLNAIQMSAIVAQQTIRNKRPKRGYRGRILSYFKPKIMAAKENGFVFGSFKKGLTGAEFIMHSMGGREALVNTAIRTGRSGYMQRRLINALQDLAVENNLSVRNAGTSIVQFIYGGDGKDPMLASKAEAIVDVKKDDVDTA